MLARTFACQHCDAASKAGRAARLFCPETCGVQHNMHMNASMRKCQMCAGCDNITSPLLDFRYGGGCPSTCKAKETKQLSSIRCADVSADDPKLKALAMRYIHWFNATKGTVYSGMRREPHRLRMAITVYESGCAALWNRALKEVPGAWSNNGPDCEFFSPGMKTLQTLCPISCGCAHKKGSIQCPTTC